MNIWLVFLLGGLLTFGMRFIFIYLLGRFEVPDTMRRALRFVPVAVLSAIVVPELLIRSGQLDVSWTNFRLLAGVVAVLVAWRTKNTLLTILGGMGTLVGPLFGGLFVVLFREVLSTYTHLWALIMGISFIVIVLVFRRGVIGELKKRAVI